MFLLIIRAEFVYIRGCMVDVVVPRISTWFRFYTEVSQCLPNPPQSLAGTGIRILAFWLAVRWLAVDGRR